MQLEGLLRFTRIVDLSIKETAVLLHLPPSTVRKQIYRGKKKVLSLLNNQEKSENGYVKI